MKIIIDAFGGDNAPLEIIKGSALSVKELGAEIILTGSEATIRQVAQENNISLDNIEIVDCDQVITMEDDPLAIRKDKKNSSMAVGFKLLNEGRGQAFISCGNSGAMCVGATMLAGRIKGIKRTAFAPVLPTESGMFMLLDGGANVDARPEMLCQFALMGSVYMEKVMKVQNPRVGLANVGVEEHKGNELYQQTYKMLKESKLNFVGNVEGRDIPKGVCDVVVCDGFTGNLILKTYEGVAITLMKKIKHMFTDSTKGKLAAVLTMSDIKELKAKFDYNKYGGAPILGSSKPVFKAHGDSKAITLKNAVELSMNYVSGNAIGEISATLAAEGS
ncbi:MAG: phosphate acyltransferase PlsX [Ruminococcus sp.]|nr:phosphate acyltransferase PlsX [Ruminococcus sp.]